MSTLCYLLTTFRKLESPEDTMYYLTEGINYVILLTSDIIDVESESNNSKTYKGLGEEFHTSTSKCILSTL